MRVKYIIFYKFIFIPMMADLNYKCTCFEKEYSANLRSKRFREEIAGTS